MHFKYKKFAWFFTAFTLFFFIAEIIIQLIMKIQIPFWKDLVEAMIISVVFTFIYYPIRNSF